MKKLVSILLIILLLFSTAACSETNNNSESMQGSSSPTAGKAETTENEKASDDSKVLVAYFSATGTTKSVAETIAKAAGADIFEIVPAIPYTDADLDYNSDCRANREQNDETARPEIAGKIENPEDYDTVLIGFPIWWGKEPRIIDTFMEGYDFSGKTLGSFCTSGGSGIDASAENLKAMSQGADWLESRRFNANATGTDAQKWLTEIGIVTD